MSLARVALTFGLATASCVGSSAPEPASAVPVSKSLPATTRFSDGGCSVALPGAWKRLPAGEESSGFWQVEPEKGGPTVSVLPLPIRKPGPAGEWREDLAAVINLRRDADHETFGRAARFSEPEYRAHGSSPSALYTIYDPEQGVLQATLLRKVTSRFCLAVLNEQGTDEEAFSVRAKAILDALRVEP
jgi:hypothetical protein